MQFDKPTQPQAIYVGNGKELFEGDTITFSLDLTHLEQLSEWFKKGNNGKQYVQLKVCKKRETDQWGNTHNVQIDQFKPKPKTEQQNAYQSAPTPPPMSAEMEKAFSEEAFNNSNLQDNGRF